MPSIIRSTDPTVWDDIDGIYINETAPPPNVVGVAANVGIIVGVTERGLTGLTELAGVQDFYERFGKDITKGVNKALMNKKFGRLKLIRVVAAASVVATKTFIKDGSPDVDVITFSAKQGPGAYGNSITVKIEAGSTTGKKYTITDTSTNAQLPPEIYDNVAIDGVAAAMVNSLLVDVSVLVTTDEPDNCTATALATGSDGSVADTDYQTAIAKAEIEKAGNVIFLDEYNTTRNGYLKTHCANANNKMAILCGPEVQTVADAVTAVGSLRDTDGRLIYAYPWIQTSINGSLVYQPAASWYASIFTQTAPNIAPSFVENAKFLAGATALKKYCTLNEFVQLNAAGISAFELDEDIGFLIKNAVVTQIANSSKITVLRRRMTDFLADSAGLYLKNYQNAINSKQNRNYVKGALLSFIEGLERDGMLPKDSEMTDGAKAKIVDVEVLNSNASIAAGFFKIKWRQRLYSSMRYIVLGLEVGESVVVGEQE
jgi:hypothetical protein